MLLVTVDDAVIAASVVVIAAGVALAVAVAVVSCSQFVGFVSDVIVPFTYYKKEQRT